MIFTAKKLVKTIENSSTYVLPTLYELHLGKTPQEKENKSIIRTK